MTDRLFAAHDITDMTAASPAILKLLGLASTPENNGLIVDRNGVDDSTASLNAWAQRLAKTGDRGEMGPGSFKTSDSIVASGGTALRLEGNGPQATVIRPIGSTFPCVHINLAAGTAPTGHVKGIGVVGPKANPAGKQAGFLVNATRLFQLEDLDVQNCDIAYDFIGNCYNSGGRNLSAARFFSCNVGLLLRTGAESGSDLNFYNCNLFPMLHAYCIQGNGGGYAFYGGQCAAGNPASVDGNGVIQLGWDYVNGVESDGLGSVLFSRVGLEGWLGCHGIRIYGEVQAKFDTCSFNASVSTQGQQALSVFKGTDMKNSVITFDSCQPQGTFKNARLGTVAGQYGSPLRETNWYVPPASYTANGVQGNNPMASIL